MQKKKISRCGGSTKARGGAITGSRAGAGTGSGGGGVNGFTGGGISPLGPDVVVGWNDATPPNWGQLHELQRNDVAQADIAPLIAVLAGVPIPVNSVGRAPLPFLQVDAC
jgi:hypothetical protein